MGDTAGGEGNDTKPTPPDRESAEESGSTAPFLFLFGLLGFLGSLVAFVADLVTEYDIVRSLLINAVSVVVLVFWAARDTLTDPESSVDSTSGAAGTGLLLLGLYLAAGAAVVGVTSLRHGRFDVVPWTAGAGVALVIVGFLVLPRERILSDSEADASEAETAEESDG